jgi:hypothetical protein
MSTRRWLIAVAVIAVMIGYVRSAVQMLRLAEYHRHQQMLLVPGLSESWHRTHVRRNWHARMEQKYRDAILCPWVTIEPEPLPP